MRYLTRSDWGARAPKSVPTHFSTVNYVFAHDTTGVTLGADQSVQWVRNIQNFHMDSNGWADIAYSFLYDSYGSIFEGRGWGVVGAHTLNYNSQGHGFAFLGDGDHELTLEALESLRWLIAESDRRYGTKPIRGHRDVFATHCPGDWLYGRLGSLRDGPVPLPPGPIVLPSPVPTSDDYYSVEVMVTQLPVLMKGSQGQHVKLLESLLVANGQSLPNSFYTVNGQQRPDGGFGQEVFDQLFDWQRKAGLGTDGVCGEKTWRRLLCI